ncbi:hypothetical protein LOK49_Contig687G00001 [Camellia lanceoleosa]|nr:hypothetical protein LOK49_Contig687G00001 [Camellia lanceoleosa]
MEVIFAHERVQLFLQWAIMQGVAMLLQNRYQRQRLCTHIALGKARRMDVVWGETAGVDSQLWLSAPILFILQQQRVDTHIAYGRDAQLGMAADSLWLFLFVVFGLGFDLVVEADSDVRYTEWEVESDDESEEESISADL